VVDRVLTLKDMTQGSGCTPRTVRYYERQGLLRALRSAGGHRLFAASELERLKFVISLREAGWSLEDVTDFLELRDAAPSDAEAADKLESILSQQIARLERKIELLGELRRDLAQTAKLLPVCRQCATRHVQTECGDCRQVPDLRALPRCFRLIWRARELDGAHLYDETTRDEPDDPSHGSESS
jgi:DNA-binding transcriptional MerR regulator